MPHKTATERSNMQIVSLGNRVFYSRADDLLSCFLLLRWENSSTNISLGKLCKQCKNWEKNYFLAIFSASLPHSLSVSLPPAYELCRIYPAANCQIDLIETTTTIANANYAKKMMQEIASLFAAVDGICSKRTEVCYGLCA